MSHISRKDAAGAIIESLSETDPKKDSDLLEAEHKRVEIDGRKQYFRLQKRWSTAIISWISILIAFNASLTIAVGAEWLDFSSMPWLLTAVTAETFLQVVGLGYVAARYLFSNENLK